MSGGNYAITPALGSAPTGPLGTTDPSVSISTWFNATVGGGNGVIVDELGSTAPGSGWHDSQIELQTGSTVNTAVWQYSDGTANSGAVTVAQGTWHQATFTLDNSSNTLTEYIDGVQVGLAPTLRNASRQTPWSNNGKPQYYAFGAGDGTNLGNGVAFNGLIGDTRIYNGALTSTEVSSLFNATQGLYTTPEPGSLSMLGLGGLGFLARRRR